MSIQQFCLRWNNHQPNFISVFTTLLNTESLVDVTLAAEGKHLQAHKVVLSACSVYFQTLFTENPSRHPIVILKDVKYSDLRIMVDFMYYGEVNVSQEQLPQVLETAKMLKIKGLTEMPESTSLTRSQGAVAEFLPPADAAEAQRHSASPAHSPTTNKRKRNRRPSTGNPMGGSMHEEARHETGPASVELARADTVTLSSLPQQRRRPALAPAPAHDAYHDRTADAGQQTEEQHNNMNTDDPLLMATNPPGLSQGEERAGGAGGAGAQRRPRHLQRQGRVRRESEETPPLRRHASQPLPGTSTNPHGNHWKSTPGLAQPLLQKHSSHPPMAQSKVRVIEQSCPVPRVSSGGLGSVGAEIAQRSSHTPAMRSGPPLSCNFCWNTVDECGRILRRKTQYHCPECRTNLCIVPCFHEYHDTTSTTDTEREPSNSASASAR